MKKSSEPCAAVPSEGRVAVVLYSSYPEDPRPTRETHALLEMGFTVDLFCLASVNKRAVAEVPGLKVIRLEVGHRRDSKWVYYWQYLRFFWFAFWQLTLGSLRGRYKLVHVHNMPDFLVFSAMVPRLLGAKLLLDMHDPMPELYQTIYGVPPERFMIRMLRVCERWSFRFAHRVLTPNEAFKRVFASRSCAATKVSLVMNTPDEKVFRPSGKAPSSEGLSGAKRFRIMYHGLLVERHGIDLVLRALDRLRNRIPGLEFWVVGGDTPYVPVMKRLIAELKLESTVTYHGHKPLTQIAAMLEESDLGVIPNRRTPFTAINMPTRIFEVLSMWKPVVAPRTQGIQDYFGEHQIQYFEPDNLEDLERAIYSVYADPARAAGVVREGRKVYERHLWVQEKEKFQQVVAELTGPR